MTTDPLTAAVRSVAATHPRAFASYGPGGDIDAAFDDAAATAGNEHGYTGVHPSLASADSSEITTADGGARPAATVALAVGRALRSGQVPAGQVRAFPVAAPSAFTRRRARLNLTDVSLTAEPGPVGYLPDALEAAITAGLAEAGGPLSGAEFLESVEVVRVRARYKPAVQIFRSKSVSSWALLDPATRTLVAEGFPNAGAARREAVTRAKVGPLTSAGPDPQVGGLEVVKVTGREDGAPFIRVTRDRVRNQVVVKVTVALEKNPDRTRTVGWVFAGTDPAPVDGEVLEDA